MRKREFSCIWEVLEHWYNNIPDHLALTELDSVGNLSSSLTYRDLYKSSLALGNHLVVNGFSGKNALLLYPRGLGFIQSFLACQYAGLIPIPLNIPKKRDSNRKIIEVFGSSGASIVLSDRKTLDNLENVHDFKDWPKEIKYISTDDRIFPEQNKNLDYLKAYQGSIAFIQYTSGSTSLPKGVTISHKNCISNLEMIKAASGGNTNSVYVCWLPHYHDLGLVAHYLASIFNGAHNVILSPSSVIQNPALWLQAITEYGGTITGAPNFAFQLCVDKVSDDEINNYDLSKLELVINAAEPIRASTVKSFIKKYSKCGFKSNAFLPAYGMAEATVFISCGKRNSEPVIRRLNRRKLSDLGIAENVINEDSLTAQEYVGCGKSWIDEKIAIVDPVSKNLKNNNVVGEIWVSGDHITQGYYNEQDKTSKLYGYIEGDSSKYLKTGDLGFIDSVGELFVTGRLKDLIIINGVNYYPQDIEEVIENTCDIAKKGSVAAFSVRNTLSEAVVVYVEVTRETIRKLQSSKGEYSCIAKKIYEEVRSKLEINLNSINFLKPGKINKTSSGKIQRQLCKQKYLGGYAEYLAVWPDNSSNNSNDENVIMKNIQQMMSAINDLGPSHLKVFSILAQILSEKHSIQIGDFDINRSIFFYGIDSINIVDIHAELEKRLGKSLATDIFFMADDFLDLINRIVNDLDDQEHHAEIELFNEDIQSFSDKLCAKYKNIRESHDKTQAIEHVLLTGASGYVGIYLLHEILHGTDYQVHCVVRAANEEHGWLRIRENAKRYNIELSQSQTDRVKIIIGDISKPKIGLTEENYTKLTKNIDIIYHCAAIDNFYFPYSVLKKTNVIGTVEMLKLAMLDKLKQFHYISSCAAELLECQKENQKNVGLINGYAQSKYVAEKIILRLIDNGFPAVSYRFGYLYSLVADMADENESFETFLSSIHKIGKIPDVDIVFDLTPVEYAAKSVLSTSQNTEINTKSNYHFYNPIPLKWSDVKEYFFKKQKELEVVPIKEFVDLFQDYVRNSKRKNVKLLKSVVSEDVEMQINRMFKNIDYDDAGHILEWCPPCNKEFTSHYLDIAIKWKSSAEDNNDSPSSEKGEAILSY